MPADEDESVVYMRGARKRLLTVWILQFSVFPIHDPICCSTRQHVTRLTLLTRHRPRMSDYQISVGKSQPQWKEKENRSDNDAS